MNGTHMRPWHCMGMAQNQAFGTESVNLGALSFCQSEIYCNDTSSGVTKTNIVKGFLDRLVYNWYHWKANAEAYVGHNIKNIIIKIISELYIAFSLFYLLSKDRQSLLRTLLVLISLYNVSIHI